MKKHENAIGISGAFIAYMIQPCGLTKMQTVLFLVLCYITAISLYWVFEERMKRIRRRRIAKKCIEHHKSIGYSKPLSDVAVDLSNYMQFKTVSTKTGACVGKNTVRLSKWRIG
jgi:hypothetical protein